MKISCQHINPIKCPYCGVEIDAAAQVRERYMPKSKIIPGSTTVCSTCHKWGVFTDELIIRKMSYNEVSDMAKAHYMYMFGLTFGLELKDRGMFFTEDLVSRCVLVTDDIWAWACRCIIDFTDNVATLVPCSPNCVVTKSIFEKLKELGKTIHVITKHSEFTH